jgi:hypothetical protein
MALFRIAGGTMTEIKQVPFRAEFDAWKGKMSVADYEAIKEELSNRIQGDEIHTAGWMPGSDSSGTVFQPIFEVACSCKHESAAKFFGLLVWEAFMNDDAKWGFGKYEKDGVPIGSNTYFRLRNVP